MHTHIETNYFEIPMFGNGELFFFFLVFFSFWVSGICLFESLTDMCILVNAKSALCRQTTLKWWLFTHKTRGTFRFGWGCRLQLLLFIKWICRWNRTASWCIWTGRFSIYRWWSNRIIHRILVSQEEIIKALSSWCTTSWIRTKSTTKTFYIRFEIQFLYFDDTYVLSSSGFMSLSTSPAPPTSINGKLSHGPANSLKSDASDARDDLRDDARLEVAVPRRCTCKCKKFNADNLLCQPPGLDVCVCSSSCDNGERSRSFFILSGRKI